MVQQYDNAVKCVALKHSQTFAQFVEAKKEGIEQGIARGEKKAPSKTSWHCSERNPSLMLCKL